MASVSRDETTIGVHADVSRPNKEQMIETRTITTSAEALTIVNHTTGITTQWERQFDEGEMEWDKRVHYLVSEELEPDFSNEFDDHPLWHSNPDEPNTPEEWKATTTQ